MDWWKAVIRRKWWVGGISGCALFVGLSMVTMSPKLYSVTTVVRVEPQRLGEEMLQRTVSEAIEQRLLTVRHELLARPILEKIIQELSLYPELVKRKGIESAIGPMRKALSVKVEGETAFELTFEYSDPELAAKAANRLPELYAEEALRIRREQAQQATMLFEEELQSLFHQVSQHEEDITKFKILHSGELPEQLESNMRGLERVSGLIGLKGEQLQVAEARRSELVRARLAGDTEAGRLKVAEDALTRQVMTAQVSWTSEHPELVRLQRELEMLSARRKDAEAKMLTEQRERERAAVQVLEMKSELDELKTAASKFQERLDNTPKWAQELSILQRDYEISRTKYQSLMSRRVEAELAQAFERKHGGTLFHVLSSAAIPNEPSKPDVLGGSLLALMISLAMGGLVGWVLEVRDTSVRTPSELSRQIALPVLASVPQFEKSESRMPQKRLPRGTT